MRIIITFQICHIDNTFANLDSCFVHCAKRISLNPQPWFGFGKSYLIPETIKSINYNLKKLNIYVSFVQYIRCYVPKIIW